MAGRKKEGVYVISVAARLADMHPQTLRLYERKGLIVPERTPKNRRFYSDEDIKRLKRIQELTQGEGLNLSGVRKVLALENEISDLRGRILKLEKDLKDARNKVRRETENLSRRFALSKKSPEVMAVFRKGMKKH